MTITTPARATRDTCRRGRPRRDRRLVDAHRPVHLHRHHHDAEKSTLIVINGSKLREIFEVNNHIGYRVLKGIGYVVARRMAAIEAKCVIADGKQ